MDITKLRQILEKRPKLNGSLIYFIDHYRVNDYVIIEDNVLMRGASDRDWVFLSVCSKDGFLKILPFIDETDKHFSLIEDYMVDYLAKPEQITMSLDCLRVLLKQDSDYKDLCQKVSLEDYTSYFGISKEYQLRPLQVTDVDYVFENYDYRDYTDKAYIKDRIEQDISYGLEYKDKLIAWGMTHDEGSIGVLHVMNHYRRQGLGAFITKVLTLEKIRKNEPAFMHIEESNTPSLNMAKSLGYEIDRRILWISRE